MKLAPLAPLTTEHGRPLFIPSIFSRNRSIMVYWSPLQQKNEPDLENGIGSIGDRKEIDAGIADVEENHGGGACVVENGGRTRKWRGSITKIFTFGGIGLLFAGSVFGTGYVVDMTRYLGRMHANGKLSKNDYDESMGAYKAAKEELFNEDREAMATTGAEDKI